ncbi:MaoC family dehydratase [Sphingomonas immobilis]|uniref:MaoC family dehydratase n=1 Tax=Sphingomonas immobilis TaxID=3063997 RepID=A0ABT9A025_9SPHN|nr:MaoC family dehydratase [Sphingomonas sp. CA1-15]MDO7843176.1 MaoC family dehydratase [Sphingomonas sp. CA1-15]
MSGAADGGERLLGQGFYWQDIAVGDRFRTRRRLVTEADLVGFIGVTGMLEELFIDPGHGGVIEGRLVPAALTYGLIEGLLFQTMIQGTGLALLEASMKAIKPVRVGDTIWATVEITLVKPSAKANRAIVASAVVIRNQACEIVLTYDVTRMLAGRPE